MKKPENGNLGVPKQGKGTPGRPGKIRHLSELNAAERSLADQSTRDALLAIVTAQGKPVTLPIEDLNRISQMYRLKIEVDREAGVVTLTSEKAVVDIQKP